MELGTHERRENIVDTDFGHKVLFCILIFHCETVVWLNNLEGVPSLYCLACGTHLFVNNNRNCKHSLICYDYHICLTCCCARSSIDEKEYVLYAITTD